jgi:hypothetical protein
MQHIWLSRFLISLALTAVAARGQQTAVTIATDPDGLLVSIDNGTPVAAPQTFSWTAGSTHRLAVTSQVLGSGGRYVFDSWSDGGAATHDIVAPGASITLTAAFRRQYLLTRSSSPPVGGALLAFPPSTDGYYTEGSALQIIASPVPGFSFSAFTGDLAGATNPQTLTMSAPRSVTGLFSLLAGTPVKPSVPPTPRLVFRDNWGAIYANLFGSTAAIGSGGVFGGDPQIAVAPSGDSILIAVDTYRGLWVNQFRGTSPAFTGWQSLGSVVQGTPSIALASDGTAWIAIRDDWNAYWLTSYNPATGPSSWNYLGGIFSIDPVLAVSNDGQIYIIGKDRYNGAWSGRYVPGIGFQGFRFGGGIFQGSPSATTGTDGTIYLAARDQSNSLWLGRLSGDTWLGWTNGGGILSGDPRVACPGDGTVVVAIRNSVNSVWYRALTEGTVNGWLSWTFTGKTMQFTSPAASGGEFYIAAVAPDGGAWWYRAKTNTWTAVNFSVARPSSLTTGPR